MNDILTQLNSAGGSLVVIIPSLMQILKKIPFVVELQKTLPIYEIMTVAIGIGGAYALGLSTPIITGIIAALASNKGYDIIKGTK